MNDESSSPSQQLTGQVRSMFYLLDERTTTLTIQIDGQTITARASGQLLWIFAHCLAAQRSPRGCTIHSWSACRPSPAPLFPPNMMHSKHNTGTDKAVSVPVSFESSALLSYVSRFHFLSGCEHLVHAHAEAVQQH
jgi:hypothetical protein